MDTGGAAVLRTGGSGRFVPERVRRAPVALVIGASVVGVLAALPVLYLFVRAFEAGGGELLETLRRPGLLALVLRTAALAGVVAGASVAIAFVLAVLTAATDLPLRRLSSVVSVLPLAVPCYVGASAVVGLSGPGGVFEGMGAVHGFSAAAIVLTLFIFPLAYLPLRASISRVDPRLIDAARSLGESGLGATLRVILAWSWPACVGGGVLVGLYTLGEFGAVTMLRCDTLTAVIYEQYRSSFSRTGAAVSSLLLVVLVLALLGVGGLLRRRGKWSSARGSSRGGVTLRLGAWRWPAFALVMLIGAGPVLLVVLTLLSWLGGSGLGVERTIGGGLWAGAATSASVAIAAGVACVLMTAPAAVLAARYPGRVSGLVERAVSTGFALPGIVVALGLAFFALRATPFAYQTWAMVIAAFVVLFAAQSLMALRASLERSPVRLEEAARTLGRGPVGAFVGVTLPGLAPGIGAAWVLVTLSAMKELPAMLLLSPAGSVSLAELVWSSTREAMFASAAAPGLALIGVSAGLVWLVAMREGLTR
ncbi:MAG: iron ABC transporter permease [Phycisphaerales bacterium]|nr:MAG: iron ABC transporter permease [Phycisphaerales bacterium]